MPDIIVGGRYKSVWRFDEYRNFMLKNWPVYCSEPSAKKRVQIKTEYRSHLPLHVTARCPFCGNLRTEPLDTYSLNGFGWWEPCHGAAWSDSLGPPLSLAGQCDHWQIVVYFLNLHDKTPDDLFPDKVIRTGPEVPSIMRTPMLAPGAVAVLHRLWIGRFDDNETAQQYSVYVLSYFMESDESYRLATKDWRIHYGRVEYDNVDYDLRSWAEGGRLKWLDSERPDLPLVGWGEMPFPYEGIEGDRSTLRKITREGGRGEDPGLLSKMLAKFFLLKRR